MKENQLNIHVQTLGKQVPVKVKISEEIIPVYTGETEITPTSEIQVLETAGKKLKQNLVVNPIPSNYGLITWNGSVLTVS